ncbi:MAG: MFS transporter [Acetobacteraceae bacterium]|nr:MFS transporter [Acetobacteraceae bacterium]
MTRREVANVCLLTAGQAVSTLGDYVARVAVALLVLERTGSALQVGLVYVVLVAPNLFGLVGGPLVDRWSRRGTMIACDLLRAALVFALPRLARLHLGWTYPVMFLVTTLSAAFQPARLSLIPDLVRPQHVGRANAVDQIADPVAAMLGFALGGALVGAVGADLAFYLDGGTFLVSAAAVSLLMPLVAEGARARGRRGAFWAELGEGYAYVHRRPALWFNTLGMAPASMAIGAVDAMLLVFIADSLGLGAAWYGLLVALGSLGSVLAGAWLAAWGQRALSAPSLAILGGLCAHGTLVGVLTLLRGPAPLALTMFVIGVVNMVWVTAARVLIQALTPPGLRGRVFGLKYGQARPLNTVGAALAGWLADAAGVRAPLAIAGALIAGLGLAGWAWPAVRRTKAEAGRQAAAGQSHAAAGSGCGGV